MYYNTLIVLAGTGLLGANAGLIGSFAVLRRRALTGDALAHASLPGICLAFLLIGQRHLPVLLLGALATGLLGIGVISVLRHTSRIKEDAAIGIVLSVFFGAGVVLSQMIQHRTTTGSKAGLDSFIFGKTAGIIAQDVFLIAGVSLFGLLLILCCYKEFQSVVFDPGFASVQGLPVLALDFVLMGMVAITVVIGLPAVGVVLMSALLILPGAAARFWTDRLSTMLMISVFIGAATGTVGTMISANSRLLPAGPIIVLVGTFFFLVSVLFAPRRGAFARWTAHRRFRHSVAIQTVLCALYREMEAHTDKSPASISIASLQNDPRCRRLRIAQLLTQLELAGLLRLQGTETLQLTSDGVDAATKAIRHERLRNLLIATEPELFAALPIEEDHHLEELLPHDVLEAMQEQLMAAGQWPALPSKTGATA